MMGYRSDVGAAFYVVEPYGHETTEHREGRKERALALLKVWWQAQMESCPHGMWHSFEAADGGFKFFESGVKWSDAYPDVQWFIKLVEAFIKELIENKKLDGGSGLNECFAYEFVRIGADYDDIVTDNAGHTDYRVQLRRTISFS